MRRLLLGRAGTGKTHACLDLLKEALAEGRRALLLVPTYSQAEHLRGLVLKLAPGMWVHAVETFSSLAERVTGVRLRDLLPAAAKDRAAREALEHVFPEAAALAGFRAEFLRVVKEIKDQGGDLDEAVKQARAHFPESSRGARLFRAFDLYVQAQGGRDHEDLLRAARDRLAAEPLPLDMLLVDGFHDFTPVEREVLDLLAAHAGAAVVTLPLDPDDTANPVFRTAARTAAAFAGWEQAALRENRRARGDLKELERCLFLPGAGRALRDGVEVLACPTEEDEADRIARLVAASGRPFNEFLVVRRGFEGLHGTYRAAFRRHGVALRFFAAEPLEKSPAARAVALWLRHVSGGVELAELMPLLRSPYLREAPVESEVDRLAELLREEGPPESLEDFGGVRRVLGEPEGTLEEELRARFGVADALKRHPDGTDEIARAAQLFRQVLDEARSFADLPLADAAAAVLRRLPLLQARPFDRRHDCVYAVDAKDARQWEKPVVVVAGLSADAFPRQVRQDLFLRDDERAAFGEQRGMHLPLRAGREDEERYLFYVALTRARERLVLTWTAYDEMGTPRAPSPYLEETFAHLDPRVRSVIPLSELFAGRPRATSRADLLPVVTDGLVHGDPAAAALYDMHAVPREDLAWPRRLEVIRTRPMAAPPPGLGDRLSPSAINNFLRCPYLYLVSNVFFARQARERALDALRKGNILHAVLERAAKEDADAGTLFDEVFAAETRGIRIGLDGEADRRWMRSAAIRAAGEVRARPPETVEWKFEIPVGDVTLRGRIDRVDRTPFGLVVRDYKSGTSQKLEKVLRFEDVQLDAYLLAVDDPAGAVFDRLKAGDAVGFAVPEVAKEIGGRHVAALDPEQIEARRERMRGIVAATAAAAREGRLAVKPRQPENCRRGKCDAYDLCRVARARWLARAARAEEAEA